MSHFTLIRLNMVVWYCLFTYNHTFYIHSIWFSLGVVQRVREREQRLVQEEQDLVHREQLEEEVQLMLSP